MNGPDLTSEAADLVRGLLSEPWGQVSPSPYETGRLVALAPWLTGHAERVAYLLATQHPNGSWGPPEGYALVPTLSAVDAILAMVTSAGSRPEAGHPALVTAADRGLRRVYGWLSGDTRPSIPDIPMVELLVPALLDSLNRRLDELRNRPGAGLDQWLGARRLEPPVGIARDAVAAVRARVAAGAGVPDKLLHALEVVDGHARRAGGVHPAPLGAVAASPAATAAWLGGPGPVEVDSPGYGYLESVVRRYGGPVPCPMPITTLERAWVVRELAHAGLSTAIPEELAESLRLALGTAGTPTGPGLPADADTTSVTLYALAALGAPQDPASLWAYRTGSHFTTWQQGEDGCSVSVNAHVLEAFGRHLRSEPHDAARYRAAVERLSAWLCEQQEPDGNWSDRWHVSPYYATSCCAVALRGYGTGTAVPAALDRAVSWVLSTQDPDGSWGRWAGTAEETAYALQVLLFAGVATQYPTAPAVARGYAYLMARPDNDYPPRWVGKDLYCPRAIVRSAIMAAMQMARRRGVVPPPPERRSLSLSPSPLIPRSGDPPPPMTGIAARGG